MRVLKVKERGVMSELDELIRTDEENILNSRRILIDFDPALSDALDTAAGMFRTFSRCLEGVLDDSVDLETLKECSKELGVVEEELVKLIESKTEKNPVINRAQNAWFNLFTRRARAIIFLLLQRELLWAATDLLRMRITSVSGYERLQAESLALLFIFKKDVNLANQWLKLKTDKDGKEFYNKIKGQILSEIGRLDLNNAYELGSGTSYHVRFASAVRGLSWNNEEEKYVRKSSIRLVYQELDRENPFSYFLNVLSLLRNQEKIFYALGDAFPEVSDPIWFQRVRIFTQTLYHLWKKFKKTFPEECAKYLKRIGT